MIINPGNDQHNSKTARTDHCLFDKIGHVILKIRLSAVRTGTIEHNQSKASQKYNDQHQIIIKIRGRHTALRNLSFLPFLSGRTSAFRFPLLSSANRLYRFAAHNISPVFILLGYLALIAGCTGFPCSKNRSYHTRKI